VLHLLQVKSAQVFKRPVQSIVAGDRAGICVTQLDAGLLERGLAAAPGSVPTFAAAIARVDKIRFYPGEVHSKGTYHIIISHETVMAQVTFFGAPNGQGWPETGGLPAKQRGCKQTGWVAVGMMDPVLAQHGRVHESYVACQSLLLPDSPDLFFAVLQRPCSRWCRA
jgi:hypothetical protein